MYTPDPSAQELAAWGMVESDLQPVEYWDETAAAYQLFSFMGSQWRAGTGGLIGLDYNVLFRKMDRLALSPDEYDGLELDIRIMESAAIDTMRSAADAARKK
jgi:hypothetical protein